MASVRSIDEEPQRETVLMRLTSTEAKQLAGILGSCFGNDSHTMFGPLKDYLDQNGLGAIAPRATSFAPKRS